MKILKIHPTLSPVKTNPKDVSQDEINFLNDQADLQSADTILGEIKLAPDHVILAGISFTTVLAILLILIVILFVLYCKMSSMSCYAKIYRSCPHQDSE